MKQLSYRVAQPVRNISLSLFQLSINQLIMSVWLPEDQPMIFHSHFSMIYEKLKKTYLTRLVTRRPASRAYSISFPQVLKHYIKMETFFCITRHDDNNSGAPDPPRRCAMGNRTASSLTFAVSLFKLCSMIIRGFRLNTSLLIPVK